VWLVPFDNFETFRRGAMAQWWAHFSILGHWVGFSLLLFSSIVNDVFLVLPPRTCELDLCWVHGQEWESWFRDGAKLFF
jgi:hypothetical protein